MSKCLRCGKVTDKRYVCTKCFEENDYLSKRLDKELCLVCDKEIDAIKEGGFVHKACIPQKDTNEIVHRPSHYTKHPSGIECKEITKHMNFCLGNAIKYIWRAGLKDDYIQDLEKAKEYLDIEIDRVKEKSDV